jgi:hypothetical protein
MRLIVCIRYQFGIGNESAFPALNTLSLPTPTKNRLPPVFIVILVSGRPRGRIIYLFLFK